MSGGLIKLVASSGAVLAPSLVLAQTFGAGTSIVIAPQLDRPDVAGNRTEPDFAPRPIIVGPLFAQAEVSVVGGGDSNVYNRPDGKADALVTLMPSLTLRTVSPIHELKLEGVATVRRFSRYTTENSEEYQLGADGRVALGSRHSAFASLTAGHLIEPRSTSGVIADAAEPASYDRLAGEFGTRIEFGKFRLVPAVGYEKVGYDAISLTGGGSRDQSFRDTRTVRGEARIEYDLSGLLSAFAAGSFADIDSTSAPAALRRDARNVTAIAGLRGDLTPVISAEVGLGYQSRTYRNPIYRDFAGPTFRADVQWYVTPLLTLRAQASRSFRNSGNRQVAGILTDALTLSAYYDPLRNLRVAAAASLERGRYREFDTRTWRKALRLQAQYRLTRSVSVGGYFAVQRQDVSGTPIVNRFTSIGGGLGITITP